MIEELWNEWLEGEIHTRDHLQFELKNELVINSNLTKNIYKQEFFLFIPNPLQINSQTYSKTQFYQDQTNLIRYTVPEMTLAELIEPQNSFSPLARLKILLNEKTDSFPLSRALDELKLLGNIFNAAIRQHISEIIDQIKNKKLNRQKIDSLIQETEQLLTNFRQLFEIKMKDHTQTLKHCFHYVDEYMSLSVDELFLLLLKELSLDRHSTHPLLDQQMVQCIEREKNYRQQHHYHPKTTDEEAILYRQGLLNRFMLEALMLKSYRQSLEDKQGNLLSAIAAGFAMLVYMLLFVWKLSFLVINSMPFVILAVVFYILKDRLKEGLKRVYFREAYRWFPDYSTAIQNSKGEVIGQLKENFAFIALNQLPSHFAYMRNHYFHEELQSINRHETIIQYKRELILYEKHPDQIKRRQGLTTIFRLNIYHFLRKASNAFQPQLLLDSLSNTPLEKLLPKIYHLNMIIRNTSDQNQNIKMFRVIIDKLGIKRVESITPEVPHET
jgi:ABC-type multidrug transport system fused ATPase/permease subunit